MDKRLEKRFYQNKYQTYATNLEFDKAVLVSKRLISLDPKCYDHHYSWARIRSDQEEYRLAGLKFREVSIRNPNDHQALNNLGICLAKQDKYDKAITAYKNGLEINRNLDLMHNIAIAYTKKGDYGQASDWYAKALEISPRDESLHNCLGYLYVLQGKYEEAIMKFNDAIHSNVRYCMSFFNKALAMFCQGGLEEESIEAFKNGILAVSVGSQQKVLRLKSCMRNYKNELNRAVDNLKRPGMSLERKGNLVNLIKGLEYVLDLLKIETEEFEKKI